MAASARMVSSRSGPKKHPVVIDLGSAFIRCGFAGEPRPIHVVSSPIGGGGDGEGSARTEQQWVEVLTGVLQRLYTESLQCRPRERKVVVCESMVSPRPLREAVAYVLFRYLQVPSLHLCAGPASALFCTGADTGMVLDIGRSEAHVVAVYRGATLTSSYAGVPLGCRAVQERVRELLVEEEEQAAGGNGGGARPLTSRELEDVAVRACLVPVGGVPSPDQVSPMEFMFAGQRRVVVSGATRTTAAEQALFDGDEEGRSLATLVLDCLKRCPRDCRRALVQNVLVAGGGALLPGLPARLAQEIEALATAAAAPPLGSSEGYSWARAAVCGDPGGLCVVRVPVPRDHLVWTGASIMASLGGIADRSLTCEQYLARRGEGGGRLLPDWMSVSSADWLFEGGGATAAAVHSGRVSA